MITPSFEEMVAYFAEDFIVFNPVCCSRFDGVGPDPRGMDSMSAQFMAVVVLNRLISSICDVVFIGGLILPKNYPVVMFVGIGMSYHCFQMRYKAFWLTMLVFFTFVTDPFWMCVA